MITSHHKKKAKKKRRTDTLAVLIIVSLLFAVGCNDAGPTRGIASTRRSATSPGAAEDLVRGPALDRSKGE